MFLKTESILPDKQETDKNLSVTLMAIISQFITVFTYFKNDDPQCIKGWTGIIKNAIHHTSHCQNWPKTLLLDALWQLRNYWWLPFPIKIPKVLNLEFYSIHTSLCKLLFMKSCFIFPRSSFFHDQKTDRGKDKERSTGNILRYKNQV